MQLYDNNEQKYMSLCCRLICRLWAMKQPSDNDDESGYVDHYLETLWYEQYEGNYIDLDALL